jgi:hypothetical protein
MSREYRGIGIGGREPQLVGEPSRPGGNAARVAGRLVRQQVDDVSRRLGRRLRRRPYFRTSAEGQVHQNERRDHKGRRPRTIGDQRRQEDAEHDEHHVLREIEPEICAPCRQRRRADLECHDTGECQRVQEVHDARTSENGEQVADPRQMGPNVEIGEGMKRNAAGADVESGLRNVEYGPFPIGAKNEVMREHRDDRGAGGHWTGNDQEGEDGC